MGHIARPWQILMRWSNIRLVCLDRLPGDRIVLHLYYKAWIQPLPQMSICLSQVMHRGSYYSRIFAILCGDKSYAAIFIDTRLPDRLCRRVSRSDQGDTTTPLSFV